MTKCFYACPNKALRNEQYCFPHKMANQFIKGVPKPGTNYVALDFGFGEARPFTPVDSLLEGEDA